MSNFIKRWRIMGEAEASEIFLSFYGDDFTGSTDVLESLTLNGFPAALFLQPPSLEEVQNFVLKNKGLSGSGKLRAFGVPGVSRSMSPQQMSLNLPRIFEQISKVPSRFFHYKVCSTFDSAPEVGSIGHAAEIALKYFPSKYIPLVVGAPSLNRFCAFGNLFARAGTTTYRLDRHPTMSRHPVTPMNEGDLRIHLEKQSSRRVGLVDVLMLEGDLEIANDALDESIRASATEYLLFDVLNQQHLQRIGALLLRNRSETPQLIVGSSAVENALAANLQEEGRISKKRTSYSAGKADRVVVMVGSCAPASQKQTEWAMANGFEGIRIDTERLVDPKTQAAELDRIATTASRLAEHSHTIIYSALGPEDPAIKRTKESLAKRFSAGAANDHLPRLQGEILKSILKEHPGSRVVVAGGDTSGYVSGALEIYALEVLAPIAPGAPLCLAHSKDQLFDGLEIALKGGQNGDERYFESILMGHPVSV